MKKKIIIGIIVLIAVFSLLFIFRNQFFNNAESNLEKSYINNPSNDIKILKGLELISETSEEIKHSEIAFSIDGLIDTKGFFKQFEIIFKVSNENPKEAKFKVEIDVNSIFTNEKTRDKSLISEEYFNAEKYPKIVFRSKSIEKTSEGYSANGFLEMIGVKKAFSFPFTFNGTTQNKENQNVAVFKGEFDIDRTKYGMTETTGIGNIVHVEFYTEMIIKD